MQLHLELLCMINRIIPEGVSKGLKGLGAGTLLVAADATSNDVLGVHVLDEPDTGCQQVGQLTLMFDESWVIRPIEQLLIYRIQQG